MSQSQAKVRIEWADIVRGVLILLVVIGHATGKFNHFIYQFHVSAFFLISGYLSTPEKRGLIRTIFQKFFTLYLPLLTSTILLATIMELMERFGCYELFFGDLGYIGYRSTIKEFLLHGNFYAWWLGAAWFALTLFKVCIINRCMLMVSRNQYNLVYTLLSLLLFLLGYINADGGGKCIVYIAQFYYTIGTLIKAKLDLNKPHSTISLLCGMVVSIACMWAIQAFLRATVDYPSQRFNNPIVDSFMACNGFALCWLFARLVERWNCAKRGFMFLGRNTLPIMLFHFMWFNVAYLILYCLGVVPLSFLKNFTPTAEIGNTYWPLIATVGITLSIFMWHFITKYRVVRIAFGQEREFYREIWNLLCAHLTPVKRIMTHQASHIKPIRMAKDELSLLCCIALTIHVLYRAYTTYGIFGFSFF